ncbi:hypothetical protein HWV62_6341 [Athelia sp. TMB]|nr:hypothetical protein HWV62_6341 [Athelia sp. TMB]
MAGSICVHRGHILLVGLSSKAFYDAESQSTFPSTAAATHPPPISYEARQDLFKHCKSFLVGHDYPTGWFLTPDFKREDVVHWILWALFSADRAEPEWEQEINEYVSQIEDILDRKLERGSKEALATESKSMRLTFDPVVTLHRPFIWYTIVGGVDLFSSLSIRFQGFHHYATPKWFSAFPPRPLTLLSKRSAHPDLSYSYRPHRSQTKLPIVFLHGIGIGTWPYLPFFFDIVKQDPDVGILVIEILPISMHMTRPPLPSQEFTAGFTAILDSLALPRVVIASHSYGTVLTAHILHDAHLKERVAATLLIDPIPFLLHLPSVAHNFVYRKPKTANEWQLWYFASRDADVSRALSRHFFWAENVLWKEELEGKMVGVVLSGEDQIVEAEHVRKYLTGEDIAQNRWVNKDGGLEVLFYPGLDHAMVFDTKARRAAVLDILHRFVRLE